ncbi:alpha/beta fold hydrolase [Brevibacillus sp. GCM10020057]|uniref:alpha/beta fold hydrolase n=1 Tax=Brevibacillus sp. GCM10020057 TaxID=3317327 RepID=UPI0036454B9E
MKVRTGDGTELYTKAAGEGPPCLFIHGGPGAWSYHFEALGGSSLETDLNMIYLDQRGCGRSPSPQTDDFRLDTVVDDFEAVREAYGITDWILLAHSFGGILAVRYAQRYPERVKALILMNSTLSIFDSLQHQTRIGWQMLRERQLDCPAVEHLSPEHLSPFDQWNTVAGLLVQHDLFYQLQYASKEAFLDGKSIDAQLTADQRFAKYVFASEEYQQDFRPATANILTPTLILAGEEDHAVGPDHHAAFRFPDQEIALLPGKHVPYQEHTAAWRETIIRFLHKKIPLPQ